MGSSGDRAKRDIESGDGVWAENWHRVNIGAIALLLHLSQWSQFCLSLLHLSQSQHLSHFHQDDGETPRALRPTSAAADATGILGL